MARSNEVQAVDDEAQALATLRHLDENLASVREVLQGLRYGNVSLTVHEGRIVQIDILEKRRVKPG